MAHVAIVGPTESGKTSVGFNWATSHLGAGNNVLAFDPLYEPWPCTWKTPSFDKFVEVAKRCRRCALFVNEAGMAGLRHAENADWLFSISRHWGHRTHVMCQGGIQLTPHQRGQCSTLLIFNSIPEVADMWRRAFNDPAIMLAATLPPFQYLLKRRNEPIRRQTLDPGALKTQPNK